VVRVDEGLPISYQVLDDGVPVYASDGEQAGTIAAVLAAPEKDIFHGVLIRIDRHLHFVEAEQIASIHERGVDLRIDSAAAAALPEHEAAAPVFTENPDHQQTWRHWVHRITLRNDWNQRS
jgi:hypothetical protein